MKSNKLKILLMLISFVTMEACLDHCYTAFYTHEIKGLQLTLENPTDQRKSEGQWNQTVLRIQISDSVSRTTDPPNSGSGGDAKPDNDECETFRKILHPIDSISFTVDKIYNQNVGKDITSIIKIKDENKDLEDVFLEVHTVFSLMFTEPPAQADTFIVEVAIFDTTGSRMSHIAKPYLIKP